MNLLLPRSDRRRFFLLSYFQSNALHGDKRLSKTLLPPFFLTSTAAKPLNNAAIPLRTFLSGNEYPSKRLLRPPLIPLRRQKPLKTSPEDSSDPSPATKTPQNVAEGLLLSLSGNEYPSKRRRRLSLIPLRQRIPLKTSPQSAEGTAIRQCDIYFDFIFNCFNLVVDG